MSNNPLVHLTINDQPEICIELYPDLAPNTVNNFIHLIQSGFYQGTLFHRVIKGFMAQGGDPKGLGTGGPGYSILGEFKQNGVNNPLHHTRGVLSMARAMDPNSAGSQFFIMHQDAPHLDGSYAAFGKVISGMEVIDKLCATPTGRNDRPLEPWTIKKISVETFGKTYPKPNIIEK